MSDTQEQQEVFTDTERLEVLMQHPDKFFIDRNGPTTLYGAHSSNRMWRSDPRKAVDDLIRRMRGAEVFPPEDIMQQIEAAK